jgi:hypothetical protein
MRTRKYPLPTKEEAEELRRMRKEAGIAIPKIAEYMQCAKGSA